MNQKITFGLLIFLFTSIFQIKLYSQRPTSPSDIGDLKELVKKEDFESLSKFLKANDFIITKSGSNYNHGSYYVITQIECEKSLPSFKSKPGKYNSDLENSEQLLIDYREEGNYKKLTISQSFRAIENRFYNYFSDWSYKNWTYVSLGDYNNKIELDNGISPDNWDNNNNKVPKDSIKLTVNYTYNGNLVYSHPVYKSFYFRNFNENLGIRCNYSCKLSSPVSNAEYQLLLTDTAYRFSLEIEEYYPLFSKKLGNSTSSSLIEIPLLKSGKTYYLNISMGGKKKKYILDSGASDVTIDESSYKYLLLNRSIRPEHKLSNAEYQIADGSTRIYKRTLIPKIQIGDIIVENIVATIVPDGQPLLLGKSLLDNFKTWKIDNLKNILVVEVE